jgi:hypothetical protein
MSFPAPYNPELLHLAIDDTSALLGNYQNFFQLCNNSCINTFTMYEIPTITNTPNALNDFICEAKNNQGICSVGGVINPYDWTPLPQGTRYVQDIIGYNNDPVNVNNPCGKIDYLTIESEFWNIDNQSYNPIISNGATISIAQGSSQGTVSGSLAGVTTGMIIKVQTGSSFIYRQIIGIAGSQVTFDRVFDANNSYSNAPFIVINNGIYYSLDFETLLYRIKTSIRPMAILNNLLPLEIYISRDLTSDQYERLIPHVDRLLIECQYDQLNYPLYNDSDTNFVPVRNVLSACSVTRTGTISIALNTNQIVGVGTQFTRDLGEKSKIIVNGTYVFTVDSIISDTQATITIPSSVNIAALSTFATYFDYMPMYFITPTGLFATPLRRQWMINGNLKSYVDVYRFHSQNAYSVGTDNQNANNIPRAFNNETDPNIQDSTTLVGLSIFPRTGFESLAPINSSPIPCPSCSAVTIDGCIVTASTTSNCLIADFTNPSCEGVCNGTISASTTYGIAPFTYYITGLTTSVIYSSSTGYFENLCADTYQLCVEDSISNIECYYQDITLVYSFYANINSFLNGFCVTITGGTQPYNLFLDNVPLSWDYNNITNCYSADCNTLSVITVTDSSS